MTLKRGEALCDTEERGRLLYHCAPAAFSSTVFRTRCRKIGCLPESMKAQGLSGDEKVFGIATVSSSSCRVHTPRRATGRRQSAQCRPISSPMMKKRCVLHLLAQIYMPWEGSFGPCRVTYCVEISSELEKLEGHSRS